MSNTLRPNSTPHGELDALSRIYARALALYETNHEKKAEGRLPSPDGQDGTKTKEDSACASILPE